MSEIKTKNILIGKITSAHGIKGHVNIISFAGSPEDIAKYQQISDQKGRIFKITIIGAAKGKNHDVFAVKIIGINNRNQAESLRNTELFIDYKQLPKTEDNEFYYVDLIGLEAIDMQGNNIGKVVNVSDFGAGGMIEIKKIDNQQNQDSQIFPFTDQMVPEVNIKKGYLKIDNPEIIEVKEQEQEQEQEDKE